MKKALILSLLIALFACSCQNNKAKQTFPFSKSNPPQGMVYLEGGTYKMGDSSRHAKLDQRPQHTVTLSPFFMDSTEVTQKEFHGTMNMPQEEIKPDLPMVKISWNAAINYCNARSKRDGLQQVYEFNDDKLFNIHFDRFGYRLPTESEWEFACRAGTKTSYYWGDDIMKGDSFECCVSTDSFKISPVAKRKPNNWHLYDMLGNVQEWCSDWYLENCYEFMDSTTDPIGPDNGSERITRGGNAGGLVYSSYRNSLDPNLNSPDLGFRCVLPIPKASN